MIDFLSDVSAKAITASGAVTLAGNASSALHAVPKQQLDAVITALGLGTASTKNTGTSAGNVPLLDGSGKLDTSILPAIAIIDTFTVASQAAMLALTAQQGDVAVRSDQNKCYILKASPASTLSNWVELITPTDLVLSVAGLTGAISASALRSALSLVVGTNVEAHSGELSGITNAGSAPDTFTFWTDPAGNASLADLTLAARQLLDDGSFAAMRTTLGLAIGTNVQAYNALLASLAGLSVVAGDIVYGSGANAVSKLAKGNDGQALALASGLPAWVNPGIFTAGGRLTLQTGTPVMTTSQTAKTTVYYSPYISQWCPIYDGTTMVMADLGGELSNVTTNSSTGKAGPAAVTTNSNYDLFVWNDAGTYRLTRGPVWTSDTARGSGAGTTELVIVKGVHLNANAITNGPAAQRGTYVGTVRSNGSSQIDYQIGAIATGGTPGIIGIWNRYNRVDVKMFVGDSTDAWIYTTATWRASNASNGMRVSFISGLAEDGMEAKARAFSLNSSNSVLRYVGIGYDSTSAPVAGATDLCTDGVLVVCSALATLSRSPDLGWHYAQMLEYSTASGSTSWIGDNGASLIQNGLSFSFRA